MERCSCWDVDQSEYGIILFTESLECTFFTLPIESDHIFRSILCIKYLWYRIEILCIRDLFASRIPDTDIDRDTVSCMER